MFPVRSGPSKRTIKVVDAVTTLRDMDDCSMKKPKVTELSAAEALHGNTTSAKVGRDGKPYDPLSELSDTTARKVRAVMGGVEYGQMQSIDDLNKSVKDYSVQAMNKWEKKAYEKEKWAEMKGDPIKEHRHAKHVAEGIKKKKFEREIKTYKAAKESGITLINPSKRKREQDYEKEKQKTKHVFGGELQIHGVGKQTRDGLKIRARDVSRVNQRSQKAPSSGMKLSKMFK